MRISVGVLVAGLVLTPLLAGSAPSTAAAGGPSPECAGATILGTPGDDVLVGTPGPDVIDAGDGDDQVDGLGGDDVICGGEGSDVLQGGDGDDALHGGIDAKELADTAYYEYVGDTLDGGPGDDLLDVGVDARRDEPGDTVTFGAATSGVVVDLTAATATGVASGDDTFVGPVATVTGTAYDDVLVGSERDDVLVGRAGRDTIDGRGGDDTVAGGAYGDPADEDRVGNVLTGGSGGDYLTGSKGDDVLAGGTGGDTLDGGRGRDRLAGQEGDDQLLDLVEGSNPAGPVQLIDGGPGHDELGDIYFWAPNGRFMTRPTGRIDLAKGYARARQRHATTRVAVIDVEDVTAPSGKHWTVAGNRRNNQLLADLETPTRLLGRGGNDDLAGSDRNDVLDGGRGRDTADGYTGHDRYLSIERRPKRL